MEKVQRNEMINAMTKQQGKAAQDAYIYAKARVQSIEAQQQEIECEYIRTHKITNEDGTTTCALYCIDDDALFEQACDDCNALIEAAGLNAAYSEAQNELRRTENDLIAYGLSLAPAGVQDTLEQASKTNASTRSKLIDLVFRLDISTVC